MTTTDSSVTWVPIQKDDIRTGWIPLPQFLWGHILPRKVTLILIAHRMNLMGELEYLTTGGNNIPAKIFGAFEIPGVPQP